ncbi:MAG: NAD-dependent epimerase/dehydratase family protein [Candidatus Babeliales bacterium]|jgi:nucleoside-diphosphate-sugar epimerase
MDYSTPIFITGGAGFIGANLVHKLIRDGHTALHVLVEKNSDLWRLQPALNNLTLHEITLTDHAGIRRLIQGIRPTHIFHLASYGGMPHQNDQQTIYDVNFYGTINLFNACKEIGFECFINTGSSSEYGIQDQPMHERMQLEPVTDYGVAKAAATQFCLKEALFNKLPVHTIRPFSVYGDYEMPTRLIPTILVNALQGTPINLSSPTSVRDFIYIEDMIELYMAVAHKPPQHMYVLNGGTGIQSTIHDVADTVEKLIGKKLIINWGSSAPRPWEPQSWRADSTQTQAHAGWTPLYTLQEGLANALVWFAQHITHYARKDIHDITQSSYHQTTITSV